MGWLLLLVLTWTLGTSRAEETVVDLTPGDFFTYPTAYKVLVPWWCAPDTVYSACQACAATEGPSGPPQGPQTPGVCQNGSSGLKLNLMLPNVPYQHCAGSGDCGPGQGSFCASIANTSTTKNGGGGAAFGGCFQEVPLPTSVAEVAGVDWGVSITKSWRARFHHKQWRCVHGDCDKFQAIH